MLVLDRGYGSWVDPSAARLRSFLLLFIANGEGHPQILETKWSLAQENTEKNTIVLTHVSSLVTPGPLETPPQGTLPETPPEPPQTNPETPPGDSRSLPETLMAENARKLMKIGLDGVAMSPHGLIFDEDEATGCPMPLEPFPTPFRLVLGPF